MVKSALHLCWLTMSLSMASHEKTPITTNHKPSFIADLLTKFAQINCAENLPDGQGLHMHNKDKNM